MCFVNIATLKTLNLIYGEVDSYLKWCYTLLTYLFTHSLTYSLTHSLTHTHTHTHSLHGAQSFLRS